jgi:hypothetical protein
MAVSIEAVPGTYQPPTTAGTVWVPILSESLMYREDRYFSPQIREQVIVSDVAQSYYHVEGDVRMEVDPNFEPYFMTATRHTTTLAAGVYSSVPSVEAALIAGKTMSITVVRNGIGFGYAGCVMGQNEYTIDNGVLVCNRSVFGLSEATPAGLSTPAWVDPHLFSAAAHSIYVAASGLAPAFGAADVNFNGFTFTINHNPTAENRLVASRAATYIAFHETEVTYTTELDFNDKTEYNNMVAANTRAIRFESLRGGASFAAATEAFRITAYRTVYNTYDVALGAMADLIMAGVNGRAIGIAGGSAYKIECKSAAVI